MRTLLVPVPQADVPAPAPAEGLIVLLDEADEHEAAARATPASRPAPPVPSRTLPPAPVPARPARARYTYD